MKKCILQFFLINITAGLLIAQGDFQKGVSYYKQEQYAKAIIEFEQIVKSFPDYESGQRILGDCYLKIKNYNKSIPAFQKAIQIKSDNYFSYYGLALAYYNTGAYVDSISTLLEGEGYANSPRDQYQLYHVRGSAYFNTSQFEETISDLKKAISIQRGDQEDILLLGIANYHLGNRLEAKTFLTQVLALNPENLNAKRYLSRLLYQEAINAIDKQNFEKATTILQKHTDQNPLDGKAWFNLGLAHLFADNIQAAEYSLLKSIQLLPENWEGYNRLGYVYEKRGNYRKALGNYQKAQDLNPTSQIQQSLNRLRERIRREIESG
jgi:tetratricopeptide (TPR) repeat protein